jgi:hypothetical protein
MFIAFILRVLPVNINQGTLGFKAISGLHPVQARLAETCSKKILPGLAGDHFFLLYLH